VEKIQTQHEYNVLQLLFHQLAAAMSFCHRRALKIKTLPAKNKSTWLIVMQHDIMGLTHVFKYDLLAQFYFQDNGPSGKKKRPFGQIEKCWYWAVRDSGKGRTKSKVQL